MKKITALILGPTIALGFSGPAAGNSIGPESLVVLSKKYQNCSALNKDYPGGVAKNSKVKNKGGKTKYKPSVSAQIYKLNASKDRDKDGIACER